MCCIFINYNLSVRNELIIYRRSRGNKAVSWKCYVLLDIFGLLNKVYHYSVVFSRWFYFKKNINLEEQEHVHLESKKDTLLPRALLKLASSLKLTINRLQKKLYLIILTKCLILNLCRRFKIFPFIIESECTKGFAFLSKICVSRELVLLVNLCSVAFYGLAFQEGLLFH